MREFKFENIFVNKFELILFDALRISFQVVFGRKKGFYRSLRDLNERGGVTTKTMEKLKELGILTNGFDTGHEIFGESGTLIKSTF